MSLIESNGVEEVMMGGAGDGLEILKREGDEEEEEEDGEGEARRGGVVVECSLTWATQSRTPDLSLPVYRGWEACGCRGLRKGRTDQTRTEGRSNCQFINS